LISSRVTTCYCHCQLRMGITGRGQGHLSQVTVPSSSFQIIHSVVVLSGMANGSVGRGCKLYIP
jgi:hypothetical protein